MEKGNKILILSNIVLVGFFFAVIYHYVLGFYLGKIEPFDSFVWPANQAFCDFIDILPFVKDLNPYATVTPWIAYFPLSYIIMYPFTFIQNPIFAYLIFASGFLVFFIYMNAKAFFTKELSKIQNFQNIFILTFLSYPFLYSVDKGNFDLFLFILLALFVYSFKSKKYLLSAFLLAVENAIKPFSVMFLLLFLYKKRYKEFFLSIILTAIMVLGGFMVLKGSFLSQYGIFLKDLRLFKMAYIYNTNNSLGFLFTSSVYMPLKWLFCRVFAVNIFSFVKYYNIFFAVITGFIVIFTWREKLYWKKITLLTLYMLTFSYLIFDYKLMFLFIPLWLFVNEKQKSKFDLIYTILFGLLLIPKSIMITNPYYLKIFGYAHFLLPTPTSWSLIELSVILNPIIMLTMMGFLILEPFLKEKKERND